MAQWFESLFHLQMTWVPFLECTKGDSQPPVTGAQGDLMASSGLYWHLHTCGAYELT